MASEAPGGRGETMDVRGAIACAVQHAVVQTTGTDGFGLCALYAVAGCELANRVLSGGYQLQAGSMSLLAAPPDGWLSLRCGDLGQGQYHAWFARTDAPWEVVDLSARHYPRWANSNRDVFGSNGRLVRWGWPDTAPEYLWIEGVRSPQVGLVAEIAATRVFHAWSWLETERIAPLIQLARTYLAC